MPNFKSEICMRIISTLTFSLNYFHNKNSRSKVLKMNVTVKALNLQFCINKNDYTLNARVTRLFIRFAQYIFMLEWAMWAMTEQKVSVREGSMGVLQYLLWKIMGLRWVKYEVASRWESLDYVFWICLHMRRANLLKALECVFGNTARSGCNVWTKSLILMKRMGWGQKRSRSRGERVAQNSTNRYFSLWDLIERGRHETRPQNLSLRGHRVESHFYWQLQFLCKKETRSSTVKRAGKKEGEGVGAQKGEQYPDPEEEKKDLVPEGVKTLLLSHLHGMAFCQEVGVSSSEWRSQVASQKWRCHQSCADGKAKHTNLCSLSLCFSSLYTLPMV